MNYKDKQQIAADQNGAGTSMQSYIDRERFLRLWFLFCMLCCSVIAISFNPNLSSDFPNSFKQLSFFALLSHELVSPNFARFLISAVLVWLYHQQLWRGRRKPFCRSAFIVAGVLAFCRLMSANYRADANAYAALNIDAALRPLCSSFNLIFFSAQQFLAATLLLVGYWGLFYALLKWLYGWLDNFEQCTMHKPTGSASLLPQWPRWPRWLRYDVLLQQLRTDFTRYSFIVLLSCWFIQMLPFFPGNTYHSVGLVYDMSPLGTLMLGVIERCFLNIWPTIVYGLSEILVGHTLASLLALLFNALVSAAVYSAVCHYIYKKSGRLQLAVLAVAFYALNPLFWLSVQSDKCMALSMAVVTLFSLEYIKLICGDGAGPHGHTSLARLCLLAASCYLLNKGIASLLIPEIFLLLFILPNQHNRGVKCGLVAFCFFAVALQAPHLLNGFFVNYADIETKSKHGLVMQTTIKYAKKYTKNYDDRPDLNYPAGLESKDPSDNHGITINCIYNILDDKPIQFTWRKIGRFTLLLADTFWEQNHLLFDPLCPPAITVHGEDYLYLEPKPNNPTELTHSKVKLAFDTETEAEQAASKYLLTRSARALFYHAIQSLKQLPIVSLLLNRAFYNCIALVLIGMLLRKHEYRKALAFIIPLTATMLAIIPDEYEPIANNLFSMAVMPLYLLLSLVPYFCTNQAKTTDNNGDNGVHRRTVQRK